MEEKISKVQSFFDLSGFKPVSVGKRLRELRKEKRLTIKALSKQSGVSVNMISLIENEKTSPSVNTLEQIAQVLEVPLAWIFEPVKELRHVIHTQPGSRQELFMDGIKVEDCGQALRDRPFQPFIVTLSPGMGSGKDEITHAGHEFIYGISGGLDYFVEGIRFSITAGESLFFEANLPHRWENNDALPAVYLVVISPGAKRESPGEHHFGPIVESHSLSG